MKHSSIKKLYYSISEVSKITGLEQYVLRYWETEFPRAQTRKEPRRQPHLHEQRYQAYYTYQTTAER